MSAASQNRLSKYGSGPRYCPLPSRSARFRWTSAASIRRAGIATNSSPSSYGEVTVRSWGLTRITSEPSPARTGRNGSRLAAACSPHMNIASSISVSANAPRCRAAR
ncbi:hypothetical protein SMICM17S_06481 [Streptomyces microflavus]